MCRNIFFVCFVFIIGICFAKAQEVTRFLELGSSMSSYRGDLNPKYQNVGSTLQVGLKLNFKKRINSHFQANYGSISGSNLFYTFTDTEGNTTTPNIYFKTRFFTIQYDLQVHLLKTSHWHIYLSQGIGLLRFTPKDEHNQSLVNQNNTRTADELYNTVSAVLPTQLGISYLFVNGYGINMQTGWLNPQTDYLDNISQWGSRAKKDNVWQLRLALIVPLTLKK